MRANHTFRGVVVPPGEHTVEFTFRPAEGTEDAFRRPVERFELCQTLLQRRPKAFEVRVEGLSVDNFRDAGLTRDGDRWRAQGSGTGRYVVQVRTSAARVRIHRA